MVFILFLQIINLLKLNNMIKNYAKFDYIEIQSIFTNAKTTNISDTWEAIGVSTDSRIVEKGNIFVALKGEKFDGHDCLEEAVQKGAAAIVISKQWFENNTNSSLLKETPTVIAEDTLIALGELASFHRTRFNFPIIAVAGSNGKTSTKELINSVLSQKYKTIKTYKNFNNRIGVPLMMLSFSNEYEIAIIEIGTNMPGEILILSQLLQPNYGIITNIGKEHLELLHDLDEVEMEETFLFGQLLKIGGNCFINLDDERLKKYTKVIENNISYGLTDEADFTVRVEFDENLHPTLSYKVPYIDKEKEYSAKINAIGMAIALNGIAAAAVGYGFGLTGEEIAKGLESFEPTVEGYARMVVENINGIKILNDCYNANPSSMEISLRTLSMLQNCDYKIAVLGDMYELGECTKNEHINVINTALELVNEVIVIGEYMSEAALKILNYKSKANLKMFKNFVDISENIKEYAKHNSDKKTALLVKGSRGMRMEELIERIKDTKH